MKVSKAEKLLCPFIELADSAYNKVFKQDIKAPMCITTKCMAWKETDIIEEFRTRESFRTTDEALLSLCPTSDYEYVSCSYRDYSDDVYWFKKINLKDKDCEGYCQRLEK